FIFEYYNGFESGGRDGVSQEDHLSALYYEYGMNCGNAFVASWFELNLNINNILTALTVRKYKWEIASLIVGNTDVCESLRTSGARDFGLLGDVGYFDRLLKISEIQELTDREKRIDAMRWDWIEEMSFFNYFTIERLYAFLLQMDMIERWISLDKEKGSRLFRNMIDSLKNEVQIPK
ncbi:hypothetical protein EZS27_027959, partial [termite gut metagenome]